MRRARRIQTLEGFAVGGESLPPALLIQTGIMIQLTRFRSVSAHGHRGRAISSATAVSNCVVCQQLSSIRGAAFQSERHAIPRGSVDADRASAIARVHEADDTECPGDAVLITCRSRREPRRRALQTLTR